ncbi:MAG TPA: hypothetical protein VH518_21305 [Tepidisphaeraceae bacterium]|jgi:hypothetical protein
MSDQASRCSLSRKRSAAICESLESRRLLSLSVPVLNSLPGAAKKLFIDFDGNPAFTWASNDGPVAVSGPAAGTSDPIPAYTIDADANNFSAAELDEINQIWQYVAEKFSPFNINVTTVDPGNRSDNVTVQAIVGGSHFDWVNDPKIIGKSAIGGFTSPTYSNTCFAWSADLMRKTSTWRVGQMGETVAHEAGHVFGLFHQRTPGDEYYDGDGVIAPIMGQGFTGSNRSIWWKTNNWPGQNSGDTYADEVDLLGGTFGVIGQRADDYATGVFPTLTLDPNGAWNPVSGIIEKLDDLDAFNFSSPAGSVTFTIDNAAEGGMLSPKVRIADPITTANVPATIDLSDPNRATISATGLTVGKTYRLIVEGRGAYGDLGGYTITGNANQFATYNGSTGALLISGMAGNNNIDISVMYTTVGSPGLLKVTDSVNGGPVSTQTWAHNLISRIDFGLGGGNDNITIHQLHGAYNIGNGPYVNFRAGGGTNTLTLEKDDDSNFGSFDIYSGHVRFDTTDVFIHNGEAASLLCLGDLSNNYFYIHSWDSGDPPLTVRGVGGYGDYFSIYSDVLGTVGAPITIDGAGGSDILAYDASALTESTSFNCFDTEINTNVALPGGLGFRFVDYTGIESLKVYGTPADDGLSIYTLDAATTVYFYGNDGNDGLYVGDSWDDLPASLIKGNVYFAGETGTDTAYLDDAAADVAHTYIVDHTHVGAYDGTAFCANIFNNGGLENYVINGSDSVGCPFYAYEGQSGVNLTLNGGFGNDSFNIGPADYWNMSINGNGGLDSMTIDDRPASSGPLGTNIYANRVEQSYGQVYYTINYFGIESPTYYAANSTHSLTVYGTSAEIASGYQWTVLMGSGDDHITVYPNDYTTFAKTLLGPIGLGGGGGNDDISFDSYYITTPLSYVLYNPYGASTCDIWGMGTYLVGAGTDIETVNVYGGTGDDYVRIDSFQTGGTLNIYGSAGNDTVEITPISGVAETAITSLDAFNFYGGSGGADQLKFYNNSSTNAFNYLQLNTALMASRSAGGWSLTMADSGVEGVAVYGGTQADAFAVNSVAAGQTFDISGGGGLDNVTVFAGPVRFIASDDLGSLIINGGALAKIESGATLLIATNLSFNGGTLDLGSGNLLKRAAATGMTAAQIRAALITGRNNGAWNGAGTSGVAAFNSSVAAGATQGDGVGYGLGSQIALTSVGPFSIAAADTLLRYSFEGDANLDHKVDAGDLGIIASNWQQSGRIFSQGDLDYTGTVNVNDLNILASRWQQSLAAPVSSPAPPPVRALIARPISLIADDIDGTPVAPITD